MAKEVKSVQVGGTKKLVMDVVKTIFVVFMFLFYMCHLFWSLSIP